MTHVCRDHHSQHVDTKGRGCTHCAANLATREHRLIQRRRRRLQRQQEALAGLDAPLLWPLQ